jgi:hypothetical protein
MKNPAVGKTDKLRARRMDHGRSLRETMGKDKRVSVADATDFLGTPDAAGLIERARKLGTARLRGVRPGETRPVEIPAGESGKLDCVASCIGDGLFTTYERVTIAWADVEQLAQADVKRLVQEASTRASAPPKQAPQGASNAAILEAKAGRLVKAVALELRRQYPNGRPARRVSQLLEDVKEKAGKRLGVFEKRTVERAIPLAWPRAEGHRAPKAAKARQT